MKTVYADAADVIAAPASERLAKKKNKTLRIGISKQGGETYVLKDSDPSRFTRFLIMGTETGSFYQSAKELTRENTKIAQKQLNANPDAVAEIIRVSHEGLSEKQDAILFSLALATRSGNEKTRHRAYEALPLVCRTLSQLYSFLDYRFALGGFDNGKLVGRQIKGAKPGEVYGNHASSMGLRKALNRWLESKNNDELAYQLMKYKTREGLSLRDILRIAKPVTSDPTRGAIYRHATKGELGPELGPEIFLRLNAARVASSSESEADHVARLIAMFDLPREVVNTKHLNDPVVWAALLQSMPVTAMVRNLGKMSSIDLFKDRDLRQVVIDRLRDEKRIRGSRIHPLSLYAAIHTYEMGHGLRGSLKWNADSKIVDALADAFDLSFKNVVPSGKNILLAIDISYSMTGTAHFATMSSAAGVAGLMAMVILRSEENVDVIGIDSRVHRNLGLSARMRPQDALRQVEKHLGGATNLSLPFDVADKDTDAIILFTDSENGAYHGLREKQERFCSGGEHRRLVLAQMVPNSSGWLRPTNEDWDNVGRKSLEIVGFDPSIGKLTSDFLAERF